MAKNGLLYVGSQLCVLRAANLREALFHLVHNALGHFGSEKLYAALQPSYYWPRMHVEIMISEFMKNRSVR